MKKILFLFLLGFWWCGCSHQAIYNEANLGHDIQIVDPKTKPQIVVVLDKKENQTFKSSSKIGKDEKFEINLEEFASKSTYKFFKHFYKDVIITDDLETINKAQIAIYPKLQNFAFGFFDKDDFEVSSFPFVTYDFKLKITKNNEEIFNDFVSDDSKKLSEEEIFYGNGKSSFAKLSPLLQYHLENDLSKHKIEIFKAID